MRLHILRRAEREERKFRGQEAKQHRQPNARHEISLSKQESVLPSRQRHVMNVFAPLRHALATGGTRLRESVNRHRRSRLESPSTCASNVWLRDDECGREERAPIVGRDHVPPLRLQGWRPCKPLAL